MTSGNRFRPTWERNVAPLAAIAAMSGAFGAVVDDPLAAPRELREYSRIAPEAAEIPNQMPGENHMGAEGPILARRVQIPSPEWDAAANAIERGMRSTAVMNKLSFDDFIKVREIFSELTGRRVDDTFTLIPPFKV
jgi:hypothetical protein